MVDLLELGNVSWAAYMANMPTDGFTDTSCVPVISPFLKLILNVRRFSSINYITPGASDYAYYMRKHNPPILYDSVKNVPERAARVRNFNDFAMDVNASALPQWM